jgi:hypothetical protein
MSRVRSICLLLTVLLGAGCSSSSTPTPSPTGAPPTVVATASATASPTESPSPEPLLQDLRVTRLTIPALGIDSEVQRSQVIPDTSSVPPGCPALPAGQETLTVPEHGIATPEVAFEGLENKAWVFGHSRWQGEPGLLAALEDITVGDELLVDGVDRQTGASVTRQRYVVEGLYLTDRESGGDLVTADGPAEIPPRPLVILQTSVRESGENRSWLLDEEKVLAKASNLIQGDVDDPCKYLLLFVIARAT